MWDLMWWRWFDQLQDEPDLSTIQVLRYPRRLQVLGRDIEMMRQFWKHGSDSRFFLFVFGTMIGSVIVGSLVSGLAISVRTGDPWNMLRVPLISAVGAGFVVPLAFFLWIVPSALIFSGCMALFDHPIGCVRAVKWSAAITATVAALVATYVMTDFGRDFDGVGSLMFFVGPVAVALAPWVAGKAYSLS